MVARWPPLQTTAATLYADLPFIAYWNIPRQTPRSLWPQG